ncbi:MAG: hypothetical protein WBN22_04810 [Verrucomicrobiia bacterium]
MKITLKVIPTKLFLSLLVTLGTATAALAQGETATGQVSGLLNGSLYDWRAVSSLPKLQGTDEEVPSKF